MCGVDRKTCLVMANSDPGGQIFVTAPNNHDRFFFLHTFWSTAFDFNVENPINKSRSYTLMSAILKSDLVCDVAMTSNPNVLMTELPDLLFSECIDNMRCFFDFYLSHGSDKGMSDKICQHWWKSQKTLSGVQENVFLHTWPGFPWTQPGPGNVV